MLMLFCSPISSKPQIPIPIISQPYLGVVNVLETDTKFCTQRNLKG